MKTAISIPDDLFRQAERLAKKLGVSRSELYTRAMQRLLQLEHDREVTASYDRAFGEGSGRDDAAALRRAATRKTLLDVEW